MAARDARPPGPADPGMTRELPTLITVFGRWPSLLDEVFPHWSKSRIDLAISSVLGIDWPEISLIEVVLRCAERGILRSIDDDPKQTLIAIREKASEMAWLHAAVDEARRLRGPD